VRQKPKLQNELSKLIEQKEFSNFSDWQIDPFRQIDGVRRFVDDEVGRSIALSLSHHVRDLDSHLLKVHHARHDNGLHEQHRLGASPFQ